MKVIQFLAAVTLSSTAIAGPSDLIISEVVEGTAGSYKWVEILNRGATPVQLDDPTNVIQLRRFANGSVTPGVIALTGTLPAGGRHVVANNQTDYRNVHGVTADASQYSTIVSNNGDDSFDIYNLTTTTVIDGFAKDWVPGAANALLPAADGVVFRVLSALPNSGDYGQTTRPTSDSTTSNGIWHYFAFTASNGTASTVTTPFAGGGAAGAEAPVALSGFSLE